jgi:hypothetical protein
MSDTTATRWTLRDLPVAARVTIGVFLVSVGIGYVSALINMHFQIASPGEAMPTLDDTIRNFRPTPGKVSHLERLLIAHPSLPFNGTGSMRAALTSKRVGGWVALRKAKALEMGIKGKAWDDLDKDPELSKKVSKGTEEWLDGERLALIAWIRAGGPKEAYEEDSFPLKDDLQKLVINPKAVQVGDNNQRSAKIKSILDGRCARCHDEGSDPKAGVYPLTKYEEVALYLKPEVTGGMSLTKLALTTHVHLLGFSVLYGMTGLLFALTGYWALLRVPLAPLPLLAQVVDISFWWLSRMDEPYGPMFAMAVPISGGVVAMALMVQIFLTLFDLGGKSWKVLLFLAVCIVIGGAGGLKTKLLDGYLESEKQTMKLE